MTIAIGADHAGYALKDRLAAWLREQGHQVLDLGTSSADPVDYPDYAKAVGEAVVSRRAELGVLCCGSGVGASMAANKIAGIRAALCHDMFSAHQSREDDDANVLCLGPRVIGPELAMDIVRAWIAARFSGAERHQRRLAKMAQLESKL